MRNIVLLLLFCITLLSAKVNEYKSDIHFADGIDINSNKVSLNNKKDSNNTINTLTLSIEKTTLNKDANTTITLKAIYSDNTTKTPKNIEWLITPKDAIKIKGNTITALKDTNVTIQARVGNTLSNKVKLNIYWEVDGYRLPPEPDPKVNNATLLGVDVNKNGVRDDVERWIYKTYHHPIERGIFMQNARAYQKVIVDPSKAKETMKYIIEAAHCQAYWSMGKLRMKKRKLNYSLGEFRDIELEIRPIQFNTLDRIIAYHRFNKNLSGGVYGDNLRPDEWKNMCQFDENGILKAE